MAHMHEVMNYAAYDLDSPPDECPSTALLPLPRSFGLRDVQGLLEDSWDLVAILNGVRTFLTVLLNAVPYIHPALGGLDAGLRQNSKWLQSPVG